MNRTCSYPCITHRPHPSIQLAAGGVGREQPAVVPPGVPGTGAAHGSVQARMRLVRTLQCCRSGGDGEGWSAHLELRRGHPEPAGRPASGVVGAACGHVHTTRAVFRPGLHCNHLCHCNKKAPCIALQNADKQIVELRSCVRGGVRAIMCLGVCEGVVSESLTGWARR